MSDPKINPCDFCHMPKPCKYQDNTTKGCSRHICSLDDNGCGLTMDTVRDCFGYNKCPNVKEFYQKKGAN